jgi:hypothetical protein
MKMKPSEMKAEFAKLLGIKTVIDVSYGDVETIIDAVFKNERHEDGYELPCLEEMGSGDHACSMDINVKPETLNEDVAMKIFQGKWPQYRTRSPLCELCRRGLIPAGNYLIDISW